MAAGTMEQLPAVDEDGEVKQALRVDPSHHILGMRLDFFVAGIVAAAGLAWFVSIQRRRTTTRRPQRSPGERSLSIRPAAARAEQTNVAVVFDTDVNGVDIGEQRSGAGHLHASVCYSTTGAELSTALIADR